MYLCAEKLFNPAAVERGLDTGRRLCSSAIGVFFLRLEVGEVDEELVLVPCQQGLEKG